MRHLLYAICGLSFLMLWLGDAESGITPIRLVGIAVFVATSLVLIGLSARKPVESAPAGSAT